MKNFIYYVIVAISLFMASCVSNSIEPDSIGDQKKSQVFQNEKINESEAIVLANSFHNSSSTKGVFDPITEVQYVLNSYQTRSENLPDTLAYIINYGENDGFVIISGSRRIDPLLAFSDEGTFASDNQMVNSYFIENIAAYIQNGSTASPNAGIVYPYVTIDPIVQIKLNQEKPWNKFVVQEYPQYPECPVGCTAVAAALVMTHSKKYLTYHGATYNNEALLKAIKEVQDLGATPMPSGNGEYSINGLVPAKYGYQEAIDSVSKILYYLGKDIPITYSAHSSSGYSYNVYLLLKNLSFQIPSGYATFDLAKIVEYIINNHIIYVRGDTTDPDESGGHAWVCDGCRYFARGISGFNLIDGYLHCDWGWGGINNGYYKGEVFNVNSQTGYKPTNYFAILREY